MSKLKLVKDKKKSRRRTFWAAKIDFNTHDIKIRKMQVYPHIAERHTHIPYEWSGDIYAPTESQLLEQIAEVYSMHLKQTRDMLRQLNREDGIPAEYIPHQNGTAKHIDLDDEKAAR